MNLSTSNAFLEIPHPLACNQYESITNYCLVCGWMNGLCFVQD
jgi:hypothetical protein